MSRRARRKYKVRWLTGRTVGEDLIIETDDSIDRQSAENHRNLIGDLRTAVVGIGDERVVSAVHRRVAGDGRGPVRVAEGERCHVVLIAPGPTT